MDNNSENIKQILRNASTSPLFKLAVQNAFNHIIITDEDGIIIYANSAVERITGFTSEEIMGKTPRLWGRQMSSEFYTQLWDTIKVEQKPFVGELTNRRKSGETYFAKAIISPIKDSNNKLIGYIGTEEDITKAKEVEKMKTEFISITAHQLRTPLTATRWILESLLDGTLGEVKTEQLDALINIQDTNTRLINLVNSLLNIARIESGKLSIKTKPTDLEKLTTDIINDFRLEAENKNISIEFKKFIEIPEVEIDDDLVKEILTNLISNSIKYSPNGTTVNVNISRTDGNLIFCVKDQGIGIPLEEQDNLFTKFFRCTNAKESDINGTGLGLYFIKLIIESYHGKIWFDSTPETGAAFYFTLPVDGMKSFDGEVGLS